MQEMHDGLGSSLVSALRVVENGKMQSGELAGVLKDCIDDLKLAIDSIEPVDDDLLLLLATLRFRLGARLENTGIRLHWKVSKIPPLAIFVKVKSTYSNSFSFLVKNRINKPDLLASSKFFNSFSISNFLCSNCKTSTTKALPDV